MEESGVSFLQAILKVIITGNIHEKFGEKNVSFLHLFAEQYNILSFSLK